MDTQLIKYFRGSLVFTLLGLTIVFFWGGFSALTLTLLLAILEISLSFDNAVMNATVLTKMDKIWQARFLTWGVLIAVFVVRFLLPLLIVALVTQLNILEVLALAIESPAEYAAHLSSARIMITSFGGLFLLMVFVSFLFDQKKSIHWVWWVEKKLNGMGKIKSLQIVIALLALFYIQQMAPESHKLEGILSGILGIFVFILLKGATELLGKNNNTVGYQGMIGFLYLEILDTSFSLDGVMGAFAITQDIVIILLGLAIGAIFVRSLTVFLVHKGTFKKYLFLEHGAHFAIGALALIMLASIKIHVPEIITGLTGVVFVGLALLSSLRYNRKL